MVITELRPLILNLSDDDVSEEDEGGNLNPSFPSETEFGKEDGLAGKPDHKISGDGFDLDEEMIENPGEEDF